MDTQRTLLFVALSVIILLLWQAWEAEQRPVPTTAQSTEVPVAPSAPAGTAGTATAPASAALESSERVEVTTDLLHAVIDTQGGDLRVLELRKYPLTLDPPQVPLRLLDDQGPNLFVAQSGLITTGDDPAAPRLLPYHKSRFRADAPRYTLADGQDSVQARLTWDGPGGVQVAKVYTFHRDTYVVDLRYEVRNAGRETREVYLYAQWLRRYVDQGVGLTTLPTYTGGVIYTTDKKYEKIKLPDLASKPLVRDAAGGWAAVIQHYFVGAWLPGVQERVQYFGDRRGADLYAIGYKTLEPVKVAPGDKATFTTRLYAGPKEQHRLEKVAEGLKLTVDYGWLTFIAAPLFWVLEWLHKLLGNWGWSIIALTILIKLAFHPLSVASYRSMAQMRKLQPRLQAIKERYGADRQKLNEAMMEMYKTEKINPLGGCLPILIQIPVFIALYWVLLESVELRQAPWALWIKDLSTKDPYYVLPLLMGGSMLVQQLLNPQPLDDMQKKIMYVLPVVFTFMFLWFPAGLVLYWVVQNVLSIAQQWWINRQVVGTK